METIGIIWFQKKSFYSYHHVLLNFCKIFLLFGKNPMVFERFLWLVLFGRILIIWKNSYEFVWKKTVFGSFGKIPMVLFGRKHSSDHLEKFLWLCSAENILRIIWKNSYGFVRNTSTGCRRPNAAGRSQWCIPTNGQWNEPKCQNQKFETICLADRGTRRGTCGASIIVSNNQWHAKRGS